MENFIEKLHSFSILFTCTSKQDTNYVHCNEWLSHFSNKSKGTWQEIHNNLRWVQSMCQFVVYSSWYWYCDCIGVVVMLQLELFVCGFADHTLEE